jgi:hypothetical protein
MVTADSAGVLTGRIFDSQRASTAGMPAMPSYSIPVTLTDLLGMQRLQDVTLIDATTSERTFNPLITRLITDEDYLEVEPAFSFPDQWVPDQTFASSVFESENLEANGPATRRYMQLLITPEQFKGNKDGGMLRMYDSMTIELSYLSDGANPELINDTSEPVIWDTERAGAQVRATIIEYDGDGPGTVTQASVMVKTGLHDWQEVALTLEQDTADPSIWYAKGVLPATASQPFQAMLFAEDAAGNVGVETFGGTLAMDTVTYIPRLMR